MTQEEKRLLLKDLCARLPYGVTYYYDTENAVTPKQVLSLTEINNVLLGIGDNIKPYLRPISSMTDEEKDELFDWGWATNDNDIFSDGSNDLDNEYQTYQKNLYDVRWLIDWLNAHHFDYQGLIEKGLALTASEGMYKTE